MRYEKNKAPTLSKELFQNPTADYRGAPFWAWNCTLDPQILDEQMDVFEKMGFGGAHYHPRTGLGTPYLGEEYMKIVRHCVEYAKEKGMYAYLYDEDRWPSGFGGGFVTQNPAYRGKYICFTSIPYGGGEFESKKLKEWGDSNAVAERAENGTLLTCYDVTLDEKGCLKEYRRIGEKEQARGKKWYAYVETMPESPWYNGQTYVNTLSKEAMGRFIEVTYEAYKKEVGNDFGNAVPSIFTDEPQFSHKTTLQFPEDDSDVILPWVEDLPETFEKAYGEDLLEKLPELFWELPEGGVSVCRYRFHDHVTERFTEAFADQCGRWCEQNSIMLTGHMMDEPSLLSQTHSLGEAMRAYRSFQQPGIDMLCNAFEYNTAKQAQSAAHQYGRCGVLSEIYGCTGWEFDFRGHKIQGDWQAALGVTARVPHLSWVSMAGESKRDYPASISYQSPWCEEYKLIEDHFARVNTALTRGQPVVRVGVIHPIESYWLHWGPSEQTSAAREQLDDNFANLTEWLLFGAMDFDFICESLLPGQCPAASAPLQVGEMAYDVVVVPGCETLRATTVERLRAFVQNGGRLVFLGEAPQYMDALPSKAPAALYAEAEAVPFSRTAVLAALEPVRMVELRAETGAYTDDLIYQMRQDEDCRWLFIAHGKKPINTDFVKGKKTRITLDGRFHVEQYHTLTGEITPLATEFENGKTRIWVTIYNQDSLLLKLTEAAGELSVPQAEAEDAGRALRPVQMVPVTLSEPNVLLFDYAEYAVDDAPLAPLTEILRADDAMRLSLGWPTRQNSDRQPWSRPKEEVTHTAHLRIPFESLVEVEDTVLALEDAERVKIVFNGREVLSMVTGYYVDHAIKTVNLGAVRKGENVLELFIPFGQTTNVEWCYLLGDFGVRMFGAKKLIVEPVRALGFGDVMYQGLPFYGGNITYHIPVETKAKRIRVHIPYYRGALLSVTADGEEQGKIVFAPYDLELSAPESGSLDVTLFGNRANTFTYLHKIFEDSLWIGPDSWRTKGDQWNDGYEFKRFGILNAPVITALGESI